MSTPPPAAPRHPVARVALDVPHPHLDRLFDYAVPASMDDGARPGVRVRVRFAGTDVDGFVVERLAASDHPGRLLPLRRVVSSEVVLPPAVLRLARAVADHYAGTLADVLRLAVPPRHATTEKATRGAAPPAPTPSAVPDAAAWADYPAGSALLQRLAAGESPAAVWTALPGQAWAAAIAEAVVATVASGRGACVVVPDRRDLDLVHGVVAARIGAGVCARLEADLGPAARYAQFLALSRGDARVVVGTRAAAFAPVADLGLCAVWQPGEDSHAEQRAPYPHAAEVLAIRGRLEGAALLSGGWSRTPEQELQLRSGRARAVAATRGTVRARWPRIAAAEEEDPRAGGRVPRRAWTALSRGLSRGPVLVQVPRAGYLPALTCATCRAAARCGTCAGPLRLGSGDGVPGCGWCGTLAPRWHCPHCEGDRLRAGTVGLERTAEEFGRAFPGRPVLVSRPERSLPDVPEQAVVLATPGVEPVASGGYAAAVLLDGDRLLGRPDLRAAEEALHRWFAAAALVRAAGDGGEVVVCAGAGHPAVQALVRCDPAGFAERELDERAELALPPAAATATVEGPSSQVTALLAAVALPPEADIFGPVPVAVATSRAATPPRGTDTPDAALLEVADAEEPAVRALVRAPLARRADLAAALARAAAVRSAHRGAARAARVRLDPRDIG